MAKSMYCSACGNTGKPVVGGSFIITILLLCIGIIPGIIYEVFRIKNKKCRYCGSGMIIPVDSPMATQMRSQRMQPIHQPTQSQMTYQHNIQQPINIEEELEEEGLSILEKVLLGISIFSVVMLLLTFPVSIFAGILFLCSAVFLNPYIVVIIIDNIDINEYIPLAIGFVCLILAFFVFISAGKSNDEEKTEQEIIALSANKPQKTIDEIKSDTAQKEEGEAEKSAEERRINSTAESINKVGEPKIESMKFENCVLAQLTMAKTIAPNYKTVQIINTNEISMVRFCTNDGSVLSTCDAVKQTLTTAISSSKSGCY